MALLPATKQFTALQMAVVRAVKGRDVFRIDADAA
jgi:hypothetical protein